MCSSIQGRLPRFYPMQEDRIWPNDTLTLVPFDEPCSTQPHHIILGLVKEHSFRTPNVLNPGLAEAPRDPRPAHPRCHGCGSHEYVLNSESAV